MNIKKHLFSFLFFAVGCLIPSLVSAQQDFPNSRKFNISGPQTNFLVPPLQLPNNTGICTITFTNIGTGDVVTAEGAADNIPSFYPVLGIGTNGVISPPTIGQFGGLVVPQAQTFFTISVTQTSGLLAGSFTCNQNLSAGGTGGGGGGTVTQGTAAAASGAWPTYLTSSGTAYDARQTRALTTADQVTALLAAGSASIGNVGLNSGSNIIGSVNQNGSWNVGLTGTLPGFATTPTVNAGTGFPTPIPTLAPQNGGSPVHSVDATPVPCATPAGTGICSQHSNDLVVESGPVTLSANGPSSILALSGVHTLCNLNLTAPFTGSITVTASKDGTTNFNPVDIVPRDGAPVTTLYQLAGSASDYGIDVSGKHGAQFTVLNYGGSGSATLQCDVAAPLWTRTYQQTGGVPVIGTTIGQKMTYATPTTTAGSVAGSNVAIPVSSGSGFVIGESVTITGSDSNTDTTTLSFVSGNTLTFTTLNAAHISGSTVTPNSSQSFIGYLTGAQNECTGSSDNAFAGIAVSNLSTNGTSYAATKSFSNSQSTYNQGFDNITGINGSWTSIVTGNYYYKLTISGWSAGGMTMSCDVGVRSLGPIPIGTGLVTACPAGNATTPTEITGGPNGIRFVLGSSSGSISEVPAPSSATTPSPNGNVAPTSPPNVFTYTYPYTVTQNELLPAGWSVYVTASTSPCSYRKW